MTQPIVRDSSAPGSLQTFEKGLQVLEALAECGQNGATLADLSRQLGFHKSSLYRLIITLQQRGYVERRVEDDRYRLGLQVLSLACAQLNGLDFHRVGFPYLRDLGRQVHDTIHLAALDREEAVTVDRIEGDSSLSLRTQVGARRPLYCTAVGKAMLAFVDQPFIARVLEAGLKAVTPQTTTDPKQFLAELQEIRVQGYALDDEEYIVGVRCIAAPIFDYHCEVLGAVSLSVPVFRTTMSQLIELAAPVTETARLISERLGFRPAMRSVFRFNGKANS